MKIFLISKINSQKFRLNYGFEFAEEADVVLEVVAEVLDLPFEHRDALDSHTESKTAIYLGINAGSAKDIGIDHTAAQNLEPSGALADVATFAVTDVAAYVHLC